MGQREGKVALVTGGSAGIGLATARRFAAEGAKVYLTGRRNDVVDGGQAAARRTRGPTQPTHPTLTEAA